MRHVAQSLIQNYPETAVAVEPCKSSLDERQA
jgi:hypothetical protein